jgi:hypothetical protein
MSILWHYGKPGFFIDGVELDPEYVRLTFTIPQTEEDVRRIAREEARKELAALISVNVPDTIPEEEK